MKILMIGGSGFLSGRVLKHALAKGHKVIAVTRGQQAMPSAPKLRHIACDRDADDLVGKVSGESYDAVLDVIAKTPAQTRQAIELAKGCRRLIMVSTDYVYHPAHRKLLLKEDEAVFSDIDDYGGVKRQAEVEIIKAGAAGTVDWTILRPPHIYGPGSNPGTIPNHGRRPTLLDDIAAGTTLRLLQGGLGLIQPIHVEDLGRVVVEVIDKPASFGQAVSAAGPELMTNLDYYKELAAAIGAPLTTTTFEPTEDELKGINPYVWGHRYYDLSKLNAILPGFGYTPFADGIRDWVAHLRKAK